MHSIRWSLLVYFLGLLAVALAAAALLAYQTAQQTLLAKKVATSQLIETQFNERCREEESRLNDALLFQAQTLARLAQFQIDRSRWRYHDLRLLGLLSSAQAPGGYLLTPAWVAESVRGPFSGELFRRTLAEIKLNEDDLLHHVDGQVAEYFQIDSAWGNSYHSRSLGARSLPLDMASFAPNQLVHWEYDDLPLEAGITIHRVLLKASAVRFSPTRDPQNPREPREARPPLTLYVHCACTTDKRDAALAVFHQRRDEDLDALEVESAASLASLRNHLLAMSTATFAAAVLGTYWLVRRGLSPLQRLGEAVSRVSARDFRLSLDEKRLPPELRPIAERLTRTLELLKRAFAREKQATADLSHELRTPLAALLTTTEVGLRKPRSPEDYRELLQDCRLSAQQMNQVVERLLTLARLDAGVDVVRPQTVDAAELAEQCATLVRPLAEARGLRLQVHRNGPAWVKADPDKLREVLNNLLHNAIQYNRPDGKIDLTVCRDPKRLTLEVRDTGVGIAADSCGHIFERFYRADPARGGDDGLHAGLGLAIVKEYVDLMQGSIEVQSQEGQGSTFRVQLPA